MKISNSSRTVLAIVNRTRRGAKLILSGFLLYTFSVSGADIIPGFVRATFTGQSFDATSDIWSNAEAQETYPTQIYATQLPTKTTVGYGAYVYLEEGVSYDFKGYCDDFATVRINDTWVVPQGAECEEHKGAFYSSKTGWYKIEFRIGNNEGNGGCCKSNYYGILWKKSAEVNWRKIEDSGDGSIFRVKPNDLSQVIVDSSYPIILSAKIRETDQTILDVTYIVLSSSEKARVRALAFKDGERSFANVIRPETFIEGTSANIGDNVPVNTELKLAWKVAADWNLDLAKIKFEILIADRDQLPLNTVTIPKAGHMERDMVVSTNEQTDPDIFNALLWHYADAKQDLKIKDGYLYTTNGTIISSRTTPGENNRRAALLYCYDKMGWEPLENLPLLAFVKSALRMQGLAFNHETHNAAIKQTSVPSSLYVGEKMYWWVDLTTGEQGYLDSLPMSGWGDEYKTTKLLMRRIAPGTLKVGNKKTVTITRPFFIGVYEVTQKQYAIINGSNPSGHVGDMRPVERVSYRDIRGADKGMTWPNGADVDATSWLGKLRTKIEAAFDLPTESQWEYACRAGTTSDYYNGAEYSSEDLSLLARWYGDINDGKGGYTDYHTTVGSYLPNAWGLYDMLGNVRELCLDWSSTLDSEPATDWLGPPTGSTRVYRGGGYYVGGCSSSYRANQEPAVRDNGLGFRLCCSLSEGVQ